MAKTHLSLALLASTTNSSITALAKACGLSQPALSRLISEDRRADSDTLRALHDHLPAIWPQILLGHLNDEITRTGDSTLNWTVAPKGPVEAGDLATLEAAIGGPNQLPEAVAVEIRNMVHHLANMVRHYRTSAESTSVEMVAESPQGPYGTGITAGAHDQHFRASVLGALEEEEAGQASAPSPAGSTEPAPPPAEPASKGGKRKR